jgi:flagellin-like hook-associated protein FlgL
MESLIFNQKKCQSIVIKTMAAIAAGVGMMVMCSSSLAAALMMGGSEETPAAGAGAGAGAGAATDTGTTGPVSGRYIKLEHSIAQDLTKGGDDNDKNYIIELSELEVFSTDGSTNIALNAPVEAANYHGAGPLVNLTDGNLQNFMHTLGRTADDYDTVMVDLGSVQEITKIVITNRGNSGRSGGIVTTVLDASQGEVSVLPALGGGKHTYTWDFNAMIKKWKTS